MLDIPGFCVCVCVYIFKTAIKFRLYYSSLTLSTRIKFGLAIDGESGGVRCIINLKTVVGKRHRRRHGTDAKCVVSLSINSYKQWLNWQNLRQEDEK